MTATTFPLRLAGAVRAGFGPSGRVPDDNADAYYRGMAGIFGAGLDRVALDRGNHNTFSAMGAAVLAGLGGEAGPIDLVVLAHAVPDIDVHGFAAAAVSYRIGGEPAAFAVGDQGSATPFTALRVAGAYARADEAKRVLVLLLDQATVPYRSSVPPPLADFAVGLVLTADPTASLAVHQFPDTDPAGVRLLLRRLVPANPDATVLLGPGVDPRDLPYPARVVAVPEGQPTTGLWARLVPRRDARVVAVDYDPRLRYLCVATVPDATVTD